jgi:2-dehydropantoate 2-reductase
VTRYVIVGAGAIGGSLGGQLAQQGADPVLVARGEHAAAMSERGLRLRTPDEDVVVPVQVATGPSDVRLNTDDVLVMTTKTHQIDAALTQWVDAPVYQDGRVIGTAGELLPVCTALNGVASETMAARYFRRVVGVCVWLPAVHLVPGEVIVRAARPSGMFHVGYYTPDRDGNGVLERLESDWTTAGFKVAVSNDVMPWKYRKLINNIGNIVQALVGSNGDADDVASAARAEARQVLEQAGIAVTDDAEEAAARADSFTVAPVPGQPDEIGGSSWQSLARGTRGIETDYLNGEIALIARLHGLPAPINAKLAALGRTAAASGQRPGDVSADELRTVVGL